MGAQRTRKRPEKTPPSQSIQTLCSDIQEAFVRINSEFIALTFRLDELRVRVEQAVDDAEVMRKNAIAALNGEVAR